MSDFFSVQMNIPDSPNVQVEQSTSKSAETPLKTNGNSFHSILKEALPKDNSHTLSEGETSSQENLSELTSQNAAAEKTATSIDDSLLLSSEHDLKANVRQLLVFLTENATHEKDEPILHNVQVNADTIEITIPDVQANRETNDVALARMEISTDTIEVQENQETNGVPLPSVQANPDTNKITIPDELIDSDIDANNLFDFLSTYFSSDSTKDIHEALKDLRTTLAQKDVLLSAPSIPGKQDELTFAGLTKNFGELQDLLSGKTGIEQPSASGTPVSLTTQQQTLLERIQSFIANGQEAGTLSIKNIQPQPGASLRNQLAQFPAQIQVIDVDTHSTETSPLIKGDGFTILEEGLFAPTLRDRQLHLSATRHDSTQQFYDAKTQSQNVMNENTNLSDNQKGDGMTQSGSGFNQMSSLSTSPESNSTFSMTSNTSLNPLTAQLTDPTKTTMLPSGLVVQDQQVIQQLVERFQINRRQLDSKIQLKLHPVELGEMEIDLTIKEGSIRANIVAQSQHVQEIIERNIAKLRSVLEQQGFNVEDITVTSSSENVGDFDLSEQQLPNQNPSNFLAKNDRSEPHAPFSIDIPEESVNETNSGVNIKA